MATQPRLARVFGVTGDVPATRTVPDLDAALGLVRRLGGAIVSETRSAPGIGSWAFVCDSDGSELVLWQSAIAVAHRGATPSLGGPNHVGQRVSDPHLTLGR